MKNLLALIFFFFLGSALAQDTIPNHSMPIGRGPGVVGWGVVGPCAVGQVPTFQGPGNDPICGAGGGGGGGTNGMLGWVIATAAPFNATGNGTTDDTAAIQAAIDFAYANGISTIYLPKSPVCYKTTTSIFLDPPGNMRVNFSNPPLAAFSLGLIGEPGTIGNHEDSFGTKICPNPAYPALIVGSGQGMKVSNISIVGHGGLSSGFYRCMQPNGARPSVGIYIAGGGGGASRTLVEQVWVENFYYGISVGLNNGALGDSNSFRKITTSNTCIGIEFGSSQNFINDCIACNIYNTQIGVSHVQGGGMNIFGGNWSSPNSMAVGVMTLSAWSAITATLSGNQYDYTFTATLGAPAFSGVTSYAYGDVVSSGGQVWFCINFSPSCTGTTPSLSVPSTWEPIANYVGGIFNAFTIVTAHYGIIPMTMTAFTQATSQITFRILSSWSYYYFPQFNAVANGDLQAEVQTGTTVYASEHVTVFKGAGFNITGVHIENFGTPTELINSLTTLAGSGSNILTDVRNNYNPAKSQDGSLGSSNLAVRAKYLTGQSFPYIELGNISTEIHGSAWGINGADPILVDINGAIFAGLSFVVDAGNFQYSPMVERFYTNGGFNPPQHGQSQGSSPLGYGQFQQVPFAPQRGGSAGSGNDGPDARVNIPHWGVRPSPVANACITAGQLAAVSGSTLNPWVFTGTGLAFGYAWIWGGQPYNLCDYFVGQQVSAFTSTHHYYSIGQDLTTARIPGLSWNYKGQGSWVYADVNTVQIMFPGLGVILNDGASDILYLVTGVWPPLGYFSVVRADALSGGNGGQLSGLKTAVITGTTIKQEPYNIQFSGGTSQSITASTTNTQAAATTIANNANAQVTVTSATDAIALPKASSGARVAVNVGTGNTAPNTPLVVYPQNNSGDTINGGAANASISVTLPTTAPILFYCFVPGAWVTK